MISAKYNSGYPSVEINNKYTPLLDIKFEKGDEKELNRLFKDRQNVLKSITKKTAQQKDMLQLYANWPGNLNQGQPPMVVVSSNRACWMRDILKHAEEKEDDCPYTGYCDAKTFDQGVVPWYTPRRSKRRLYVVVHWSEYSYYQEKVGGFGGVTVIGYQFAGNSPELDIAGFGASRAAAIEAMINLGYNKAWFVDDNVININGFPNELASVEANMTKDIWGIGFNATTKNIDSISDIYNTDIVNFTEQVYDFNATEPGLLQQVVLWNLDKLRDKDINFSPLFVSSNEDVGLCNYLQFKKYDIRRIKSLGIVKIEPENDKKDKDSIGDYNRGGDIEVPKRRISLFKFFNEGFSDEQVKTSPEAGLKMIDSGKTSVVPISLSVFVNTNWDKEIKEGRVDLLKTQICAVEQILAKSISVNPGWYPEDVFKLDLDVSGHNPDEMPKI